MANRPIVIATDLSPSADVALSRAVALAQGAEAPLIVLTVLDSHAFIPPQAIAEGHDFEAEARAKLEERRAGLPEDLEVSMRVVAHTNAVHAIVDLADEVNAQVVVVGSHGRSGIEHFLIGSVAERVVRRAKCDVLVVRQGNGG